MEGAANAVAFLATRNKTNVFEIGFDVPRKVL